MAREFNYKMVLASWNFTYQGHVKKVLESELNLLKHEISRLKFEGEILINGKPARVNDHMAIGDTLTVRFPEDHTESIPVLNIEPDILYEEEDFVIVNKPAGIATHPSHTEQDVTMSTILQSHYQKLGQNMLMRPIGRLDKDVSGIVLFAKNQPSAARLTEDRERGKLNKKYIAIVDGLLEKKAARIRMPIEKVEGQVERVPSEEGQMAATTYHVKEELKVNDEPSSKLEVEIETGRTHQIRVHMNAIGHPILGDSLYGGKMNGINRPALHCSSIDLLTPFTRLPIHVDCPLPEDMNALLTPVVPEDVLLEKEPSKTETIVAMAPVEDHVSDAIEDTSEDIKLNSGSIAVVMPSKKEGFKKYLWILLALLACALLLFFGIRFFQNQRIKRQEELKARKQELYDSLVLELKQNPTIEYGDTFHAESYFKDHPGKLAIDGSLDTEKIGKQKVKFILSDIAEDGEEIKREFEQEFTIEDTVPPEISFKKEKVNVLIGEQFKPEDNIAKVEDPKRGSLEESKSLKNGTYTIEHKVDPEVEGTYKVVVRAMDLSGNKSDKTFDVIVGEGKGEVTPKPSTSPTPMPSATPQGDTTNPLILIRADEVTIYQNTEYVVGQNIIYVRDDIDGDLVYSTELQPGTYTVKTNFDYKKAGTYTVTIDAMDKAGNQDHDDFVIKVLENQVIEPTPTPAPTQAPTGATNNATQNKGVADSSDPYGQIYSFLTNNMSMNRAQAVGVLANMTRESGLQPTADNGIGYYGLCQWGGGRLENLKNWCSSNGYDYTTIDGQLHFLQMEIQSSYPNTYSQLMDCEDSYDGAYWAGYIFGKGYEVAGEYYSDQGGLKAQELYGN